MSDSQTQSRSRLSGSAAAGAPLSTARPDDELLPFLNNFHDIFTTIGVLILFVGLGVGAGQVLEMSGFATGSFAHELAMMGQMAVVALAAWLLSALLVGRQRRILPGIVLSLIFIWCASAVLLWAYARATASVSDPEALGAVLEGLFDGEEFTRASVMAAANDVPVLLRIFPVVAGLIVCALIWLYYRSFRLPFTVGLLAVAVVTTVFAALLVIDPYTAIVWNPAVSLACGLALFLAGIVFDARDPARQTRLSGGAFWLHFFAAPTLLGAAVTIANTGFSLHDADIAGAGGLWGFGPLMAGDEATAVRSAAVTLGVIGVFALVSLLINRRALIVAGLITAGVAIAILVGQAGLGLGVVVAITLLMLGGVVVLLGAAWTPVRRILLAPFPKTGPLARIFPPADISGEG